MMSVKRVKEICLLIVLSMASVQALAQQIVFSPGLFYHASEETNLGTDSESTETFYDIKLGVTLSNNIYLGAIYASDTNDVGSTEFTRTSYGASIGYMQPMGWYLMGHYFISSEYERGTTTTYQDGSGFQFDVGYMFDLGSGFFVGPQLTYKTFEYGEAESGGNTVEISDTDGTDFLPMINLAVKF